ncbi:insulin receptor substrate 1 isoform X2 [Rhinatrema bivittatum]|uniref:insulin receptor substrate 1 isoform X1 n=1 Tax=Rhinatrema bivittatum TaxID=194408 RepID=UPI0011282A83|nr:insulin receptor substrate 1 isoform X1 [Rhinatrema bivittatum]XP_029470909.1 insulin receptor substrate 1 isoform X2 [Rhinatrema bivittatum]
MASPTDNESFSDVKKVGYLRKPKSMHKRFFVLRTNSESGPARIEYYENEKKWRHKSGAPKRSIPLENCFNINKRADSKNKHLVALYTKDEYFAIAADSEQEQESWYQSLVDLHNRGKSHDAHGEGEESYGEVAPGPAFKEVWQVILKPKGLGQSKNLIGIYRLCLTHKTISFVKLNSDAAAVVLQLMNIRRCGHSENFFFIEVGRSAVTGPGEFWMQVDDSVVAQNMHETILEAMKAMSEEFRPRSKSQSSSNCSNPISVPLRRHHLNHPPPSQVGLSRRSRTESVTATSPANLAKQSSFRVRASSDGEGTMSRPASMDGSPVSPSANRTHSHRQRGSARLHPPLNHSRSIPMPSSRCSPSATSPVSLSSSSTSGHGSTSDGLFPRRSSASVSGSPSDGGFISSDEYGSSPCDFRNSFRSVTPDSLGQTPPAREEDLGSYICMGRASLAPQGHFGRGHPRGAPARGDEAELEKGFRKRTHSAGTSPPAISHQKTPSQSSIASIEEYTEMMPSYPCQRVASYRHSAFVPTHSYPEECLELHLQGGRGSRRADDGYMPMSPGVAPLPAKTGDYMPMSPKSVSAPQQIINPRRHPQVDSNGYVMMSPSGSCSPDGTMWTSGANPKLSVESNEGKLPCTDYINMSPASGSTTSTPPDCYLNAVDEPPKPVVYSYFSLPRSFKHVHRKNEEGPLRVPLSAGRLLCADDSSSSSSSSTSSDSLGGQEGGGQPGPNHPRKVDSAVQTKGRLTRPTRLSLDGAKASTLPRARDATPEPKSPGEYVNIEFGDKAFSYSSVSLCSPPPYVESRVIPQRENLAEYMHMDLGARPCRPAYAPPALPPPPGQSAARAPGLRAHPAAPRDYVSMQVVGASCSDYAEMPAAAAESGGGRTYAEMQSRALLLEPSPAGPLGAPPRPEGLPDSLPGQGSGLSAFTRVSLSPGHSQSAKVIRADPQGRRRHSSETFSSTPSARANVALPYGEDVKRHSSASFENVWLKPGEVRKEQPQGAVHLFPGVGTLENGLNYIDLDLAKDLNSPECASLQPKSPNQPCGSTSSDDLRAYASISFQKSEDLRSHSAKTEE